MRLLTSYTRKWLISIIGFFLLFASVLLISEIYHEKKVRTGALNVKMNGYTSMFHNAIEKYKMLVNNDFSRLDTLMELISNDSVRITIIGSSGMVFYDSEVKDISQMENHSKRPEILMAFKKDLGHNIRVSETTYIKYYYYARYFDGYFVRVSDRYDNNTRKLLEPDRIFMLFLILLLLTASTIVIFLTDKFGKSITTLRDFAFKALENKPIDDKFSFPQTELGNLGKEIIDIYQNLNRTKEELISEKAKLIRHLNMLDEGIAIFSKERHVITSNNNFIRFVNFISDTRVFTAEEFFRVPEFQPIVIFVDRYLNDISIDMAEILPTYEITLNKAGRFFLIKCIVFQDKSFELSVNDISKPTKRKLLKQQLTDNIAHELKTPVSSIKGFLETILEAKPDKNRTQDYLKRAYYQALRLADLVHDISLLTKIEEAGSLYRIEEVNLNNLIEDILGEIRDKLEKKKIETSVKLHSKMILHGNSGLLYSIFRNLFDNALDHAGENLTLYLENYLTDNDYYYFIFSDTGVGVPEEDLSRLFERFYRVDKGRDRKKGGTGLGLAIVKNAVQFHRGDISVKNRNGGGLEFLFTLARDIRIKTD